MKRTLPDLEQLDVPALRRIIQGMERSIQTTGDNWRMLAINEGRVIPEVEAFIDAYTNMADRLAALVGVETDAKAVRDATRAEYAAKAPVAVSGRPGPRRRSQRRS